MKKLFQLCTALCVAATVAGQTPLPIPPVLTGTNFNLTVQRGSQSFYAGTATSTYGINGSFLSPTLIVNKGDSVSIHVYNNLNEPTTLHWHGLHVSPQNDGGPAQAIASGGTWNPGFAIRNNAGTFWFHPHGLGTTERQVAKGIAGMLIVHDSAEMSLDIPKRYGIDDIPMIVQTKEFDVLHQIAIAGEMDTALFVNGALQAYLDAPAQVVRLRLLDGSSMRSYIFGLSNGQTFYQISTDGGLIDTPLALTRLRLSPGERADILINLSGLTGQHIQLMSYASELPDGIYGAAHVGSGLDTISGYNENFLNGADFTVLKINVMAATGNPVNTIPSSLVPFVPYQANTATVNRTLVFDTIRLLPADKPNLAAGPFGINDKHFDMDTINLQTYINNTEIWTLQNHTDIAHPFHIHNVNFQVIEKSGAATPAAERGWKDVVLVMPHDSVMFITRFTDFADAGVPYMYHCHLLHHEDDGMMGQYLVLDTTRTGIARIEANKELFLYPNPVSSILTIETGDSKVASIRIYTIAGREVKSIEQLIDNRVNIQGLAAGMYLVEVLTDHGILRSKIIKD